MDTKIILIYCVVSDFLKYLKLDDSNSFQMSHAEVVTHVVVSAMFFQGNHENTRQFLHLHGYITNMLSKSQLNRRIHRFDEAFWRDLLFTLSQTLYHFEKTNEYLVDSFPVSSCDTSRILKSKRYKGKAYHSYSPTRQRYFYGVKVHMLASKNGVPIEVIFTPGSEHDMKSFKRFTLDLPAGSTIYGDRAYNNYEFEDFLKEEAEINLIVERRAHSKRPLAVELRLYSK